MGKFSKKTIRQWVEFECERQMLLNVGEEDGAWLHPLEKIYTRQGEWTNINSGGAALGKAYEQAIYQQIHQQDWCTAQLDTLNEITASDLDPDALLDLYNHVKAQGASSRHCLVEHQWLAPNTFLQACFGTQPDALLFTAQKGSLRPDLLIIGGPCDDNICELRPDGTISKLSDQDRQNRLGICILDIKRTHEESVGKRHFIEVIFYAHALSHFLQQENLLSHFFVRSEGHGILPRYSNPITIGTPEQILKLAIKPFWDDVAFLFENARNQMIKLFAARPHSIDNIRPNIQPGCGRCPFVDDCLQRLGAREGKVPESLQGRQNLDVRLLPATSGAITEQLREHGLHTVQQVANQIFKIDLGDTPTALHAERPLLALKARALVDASTINASMIASSPEAKHLSMALPSYTTARLIVNVESDPTSDLVFCIGFRLQINPTSVLNVVDQPWWDFWQRFWNASSKNVSVEDIEVVSQHLQIDLSATQTQQAIAQFVHAIEALKLLKSRGSQIVLDARTVSGLTIVVLSYVYVNGGLSPIDEFKLAQNAVTVLRHILTIGEAIEVLCRVQAERGGNHVLAAFYWSSEQLQNVQDMLERHLQRLMLDPLTNDHLLHLLSLLSPSRSMVQHHEQSQKIFNLRDFVESSIGVPHLINTTWHGLAHTLNMPIEHADTFRRYWAPQFNYMDFASWHCAIQESDQQVKAKQIQEITEQIIYKLRSLQHIARRMSAQHQDVIAPKTLTTPSRGFYKEPTLDPRWNALARAWFMFSKLNGTTQALESGECQERCRVKVKFSLQQGRPEGEAAMA